MADHINPDSLRTSQSPPYQPGRPDTQLGRPTESPGVEAVPASQPAGTPGYGGYGQRYGYRDYAGYGSETEAHDDLMRYVRTVYRRRWTALSAFVAVVIAVAVFTFTATPVFEARTQILIQPENPNVISFKEVLEQEKGTNEYYQTQDTILKSRALARRTVDALKMWDSPEFGGGPVKAPSFSVRGTITGALGWVAGLVSTKLVGPSLPGVGETEAQSRVIDVFLGRLTVAPIRNSRLVDIRFESPNAQTAAVVTNEIAKQYIEQNLDTSFSPHGRRRTG